MAETELSREEAVSNAQAIMENALLTREMQLDVFRSLYASVHQDRRIALALLSLFIKRYPDDFDKDISLNNLASWGEVFCIDYWEEYAESILLPVMQTLELPAYWISHIANEKSLPLRKAFLRALSLLAREKDTSVDEVLGMLEPFLDESSSDARQVLVSIFEAVAAIDQKRLSLFMMESEKGAGLNRQTLLGIVRAKIKEK